jgi:hypothetical protein
MKQKKHNSCILSPMLAFREAGLQISPFTMSHPSLRASAPPCLLLFLKALLKEGWGLLAFCLWLLVWRAFGGFGLGFGLIHLLWAFWCGKLLEGKRITEGKRIAKGKLLKGKERLKRG